LNSLKTENKKEKKRKTFSSRNFTERLANSKWNWTDLEKFGFISKEESLKTRLTVLTVDH